MKFNTMDDLLSKDLKGKSVFVRADLNVPLTEDGIVSDKTRIEKFSPTAIALSEAGAKVIVTSHLGRPEGKEAKFSLEQIAEEVANEVEQEVIFVDDCIGEEVEQTIADMKDGEILLLENLRFYKEEKKCDEEFSKKLANLADFYVDDAFATSHRAHASTFGITNHVPSFAGFLMENELNALGTILHKPETEDNGKTGAIVGGAKVSTKITVLENLMDKIDVLFIGGAMANTFLLAQGYDMGKSLVESDMVDIAKTVLKKADEKGCKIILPVDLVVAPEFKSYKENEVETVTVDSVPSDCMALDFGSKTLELIKNKITDLESIVWNGPFGAFEIKPFEKTTFEIANFIATQTQDGELTSVGGGGDTVSALKQSGNIEKMTYISTAGGAFLEYMEGKELPGVKALEK